MGYGFYFPALFLRGEFVFFFNPILRHSATSLDGESRRSRSSSPIMRESWP